MKLVHSIFFRKFQKLNGSICMRPAWQPDAWPGRCARAPPRPAVPFLPTASSNGVCSRREPGQVSAAVKLFPILSFPENFKRGTWRAPVRRAADWPGDVFGLAPLRDCLIATIWPLADIYVMHVVSAYNLVRLDGNIQVS